ncbi:MAG: TolB family protein, partial [Gemmatimonadaceae bacterium]
TFASQDSDIWVSTRTSADGQWTSPQKVSGGINSDRAEFSPALSADGNTMYFASERGGSVELWVAKRASRSDEWGVPEKLGAANTPLAMTLAPFLSSDQRSLYFMSARPERAAVACTPMTCFDRLDLYVASARCPDSR